jgi:hypothetical protein
MTSSAGPRFTFGLALLLLAALGKAPAWSQAQPGDLEALLADVREIAAPGTPGSLAVYGEQAFPLVAGAVGSGLFEPAVAAARLGAGRMVAFGHDGFLHDPATLQVGDTGVFLRNVFTWLAGGKAGARIGVIGINRLAESLQARGLNAALIPASSMGSYDVLVPNLGIRWTRAEADALVAHVRNGGGLAGGIGGYFAGDAVASASAEVAIEAAYSFKMDNELGSIVSE